VTPEGSELASDLLLMIVLFHRALWSNNPLSSIIKLNLDLTMRHTGLGHEIVFFRHCEKRILQVMQNPLIHFPADCFCDLA
jgi:hypothetical protein